MIHTLTPAGRRILTAASELFYNEGIGAVGVELIARRAGVTKKTLYDRFGSKDELIAAYLRARDERWRPWLLSYLDERGGSARDRILSIFDALGDWIEAELPRGCAFVNALSELPDPGHPGHAVIAGQKRWLLQLFSDLAADAGDADPHATAEALFMLHEGALVSVPLDAVHTPVARARETADRLLPAGP